eukprot:scaffold170030_cov28-Tisochrysis_lutea.AAC.4
MTRRARPTPLPIGRRAFARASPHSGCASNLRARCPRGRHGGANRAHARPRRPACPLPRATGAAAA